MQYRAREIFMNLAKTFNKFFTKLGILLKTLRKTAFFRVN